MSEKELEIGRNRFFYELSDDDGDPAIVITRFSGNDVSVEIPACIEGVSVKHIAKKAFLNSKNLKRAVIPETVDDIGDWAFAYCDELECVSFPRHKISFGKAVFLECGKLRELRMEQQSSAASFLMAAAVRNGAYYLLDTKESGTAEWLRKWDARMMTVFNAKDREGYSRQILCGEEDYGSTNLDEYMRESRRKKIRLFLLRLLYPEGLEEQLRQTIEEYCLSHTKGCETEETWEVVRNEHGEDREYYALFAELGCLNHENISAILGDIGETHPEMKAYFLDFHDRKSGGGDFFAGLSLD